MGYKLRIITVPLSSDPITRSNSPVLMKIKLEFLIFSFGEFKINKASISKFITDARYNLYLMYSYWWWGWFLTTIHRWFLQYVSLPDHFSIILYATTKLPRKFRKKQFQPFLKAERLSVTHPFHLKHNLFPPLKSCIKSGVKSS